MVCPLCGKKLELKQINLETAILICPDVKCPYPVGGECIPISRKLEEIDKDRVAIVRPAVRNPPTEASCVPNNIDIKTEENDADFALENVIDRLTKSSQTDYTSEFNVMTVIYDPVIQASLDAETAASYYATNTQNPVDTHNPVDTQNPVGTQNYGDTQNPEDTQFDLNKFLDSF